MKHFLRILFITFLVFTSSCSDDDFGPVINVDEVFELRSDVSSVELTEENIDSVVVNLEWTEPTYDANVVVENYKMMIDQAGNAFSTAIELDLGSATTYGLKGSKLNSILQDDFGLEPGDMANLEMRLIAESGNETIGASNTVTLSSAAFEGGDLDLTSPWGIVGDATPNGWDGPDLPLYAIPGQSNQFQAFVYLNDGFIKIRKDNDWAENYGDDGADGTLEANGENIPVTAGNYKVFFDYDNLTYSVESFSWGVIGDATPGGWDSDTNLTYDPTSDQFRVVMPLTDGFIKFRMNDDWGVNLGDTGADGTLESGGDNIAVTAGNYIITLNLNDNTYSLEEIEHIWGVVGDATPNGWDGPDIQMECDYTNPERTVWYVEDIALNAGFMKIRADNQWTVNYGDDGQDGTLEANGENIPVPSAGNYSFTVDFNALTITFN